MPKTKPLKITRAVLQRTALLGAVTGACIALVMTSIDWHANPGGVFADESGTHWVAVAETAWSWFWPVAALTIVISAPAVFLLQRRRMHRSD